jgi:hypothetical protein
MRWIWVSVAALVASFGAALWLVLAPASREGSSRALAPATAADPTRAAGDLSEPAAHEGTAAEPIALAAEDGSARTDVAGEAAERGVRLLVVRAADDLPLAGVEVRWKLVDAPNDEGSEPPYAFEVLEGFLAREGGVAVSGADGRLVLEPADPGVVLVAARHGPLFGRLWIDEESRAEEQRLALEPDQDLSVEVVDDAGRPQEAVPVGLVHRYGSWTRALLHEPPRTDTTGRARIAHTRLILEEIPFEQGTLSVEPLLILEPPVRRVLEASALPSEPVRFVLPATGGVEIELQEVDGSRAPDGSNVELALLGADEMLDRTGWGLWEKAFVREATRAGLARFERVGLGLRFLVVARRGASKVVTMADLVGPRSSGEVARLRMRRGFDHPALGLRLLDPAGAPIVSEPISCRTLYATSSVTTDDEERLQTDTQGRVVIEVYDRWSEGARHELELVRVRDTMQSAVVDLARDLPEGWIDLGDVTLSTRTPLVAGQVVDARGQPVAGAEVVVQLGHGIGGEGGYWEDQWSCSDRSDARGSFEVFGASGDGPLRVRGVLGEDCSAPLPFSPGASGVTLVLERRARVTACFLLDPGVELEGLHPKLHRTQPPDERSDWRLAPDEVQGGRGCVTWLRREAGTYELMVEVPGLEQPILELHDLLVPAGAACTDPRLDSIDLRGRLHPVTLLLCASDGAVAFEGPLKIWPTGTRERPIGTTYIGEARVDLLLAQVPVDIDIEAKGYRSVTLEGVREDREVELVPGLPVRLVLPDSFQLPAAPKSLGAALEREGDPYNWISEGQFGDARELVLVAPAPGRYVVQLTAEMRTSSSRVMTSLSGDELQAPTIDVQDVESEQRFELDVDVAKLTELLERFGD